jgi:hypothetical protein
MTAPRFSGKLAGNRLVLTIDPGTSKGPPMALRILFIGGNGIISSASSALAVARGDELALLNRGRSTVRPPIDGVRQLIGDADDSASIAHANCDDTFDVVSN